MRPRPDRNRRSRYGPHSHWGGKAEIRASVLAPYRAAWLPSKPPLWKAGTCPTRRRSGLSAQSGGDEHLRDGGDLPCCTMTCLSIVLYHPSCRTMNPWPSSRLVPVLQGVGGDAASCAQSRGDEHRRRREYSDGSGHVHVPPPVVGAARRRGGGIVAARGELGQSECAHEARLVAPDRWPDELLDAGVGDDLRQLDVTVEVSLGGRTHPREERRALHHAARQYNLVWADCQDQVCAERSEVVGGGFPSIVLIRDRRKSRRV
mmetsp:Transcript_22441/g.72533  ORF Transcript_22441/g.72533 Transcript_22441/m.72533 type:complete len:261 (+) Transcript_22441:418-1200(+)